MAGRCLRDVPLKRSCAETFIIGASLLDSPKRFRVMGGVSEQFEQSQESIVCASSKVASSDNTARKGLPLLSTLPKVSSRARSIAFAKPPAFPPPPHLRLTRMSWVGTYHWAHNGKSVNGFIELFHDATLATDFSKSTGRWFETSVIDEIVIEWRAAKGLVQHGLKMTHSDGGVITGFEVLYCQRLAFAYLEQSNVEDKSLWKRDEHRKQYTTLGWRRGLD